MCVCKSKKSKKILFQKQTITNKQQIKYMVNCLGMVWLWGWAPRNLHGVGGDYLGEPTLMLVKISNKNTNKQETYTLLISLQYKESEFLENFLF